MVCDFCDKKASVFLTQLVDGQMKKVRLCESCANVREVRTARSRFLLCELALADAAFPKYPSQPVVRCDGYRLHDEARQDTLADPPDQDA